VAGQDDLLDRMNRLEERLDKVEGWYQQLATRVGDNFSLLQSAIAVEIKSVMSMVTDIERRLLDKQDKIAENTDKKLEGLGQKIDNQNQSSWSTKFLILLGAFGWIITLAVVIITIIVNARP